MKDKKILYILITILTLSGNVYAEEAIDASDPTRVYTYAGAGIKYTDYTNDETMIEMRAIGNIGLSPNDMLLFEVGYGWHDGDRVEGGNSDMTNGRLRWFHLFEMDYSITSGYRGWATQVDLQIAGAMKGTDGQNVLSVGALPAFGINESWSFFLPMNVVNSWDKEFANYNGIGLNISPLLVYTPHWWSGSYVQIWPGYTYFVSGELKKEGSGNLDLTTGGTITDTVWWALTYQKNFDVNLMSFRRGAETGLKNDQNIFLNFTTYF
ncbi:hypothetical protein [Hydrogenimonas cancrithermarum]|uniref:Uncharacterized protein n=1 Tax=Hydrogenimonas cancrithermarum TaxID=2993563 RepID=A0ABM8FHY8_9BACT|nr:hypothetical protein [Hydrogenimonas cancrithermarum]BDY11901.1 hypothetical protein HCR_02130 [Hydrogenimonas cancrithermarum]